ncbi:hypothetical protein RF11_00994 [Thelohanellus kitauei]|uniref:Uncharacterized protein n=1 Tax=Thelohanellus kitauei TaxID=669202 RepID=A0A0C2JD29_THEKT|nr:hypothetical protein RF11_00994 [Thelohanellus kitauei]
MDTYHKINEGISTVFGSCSKNHAGIYEFYKPMRLRIFVNNADSLKEELATYIIDRKQQCLVSDSSDFEIPNLEVEEYDPREYYVGRESAIFLLPFVIDRKACELQGQMGFIFQVIYQGRPIDKLAFAYLYLDESKTISAITRLGENDREKCLKNSKQHVSAKGT